MPGDWLPTNKAARQATYQLCARWATAQRGIARTLTAHRCVPLLALCLMAGLLSGCNNTLSAMNPGGPAAAHIAWLWWIMLAIASVVFVIVLAYLFLGVSRTYGADHDEATLERTGNRIVLIAGIIVPAIILLTVMALGLTTLRALARPNIPDELTVHVVGKQWWWEVSYPAADVVTANEIHIPVGRSVRVVLDSDNVIHSFWVPELHGKLDLVPGHTNEMWLEADEPGIYRGVCAEFCGRQHAKMQFLVIAEPYESYLAWLEAQAQPAHEPTEQAAVSGAGIFMVKGCGNCHTLKGTAADGNIGPDLTHIAGRMTLAAASMPNTRGHLAGWVTDPQHNKPGTYMPPTNFSGEELEALLAYLASLE